MKTILARLAIGATLLLPLSQAGSEAALAQQGCAGARYAAIGREAEYILLLDQQAGIIYQCPTGYRGRCFRRSHVEPERD